MAEPRHLYLVGYDVSNPKVLRLVHRTMVAWGQPVQYSLFTVRCTAREVAELRVELLALLDPNDRLMVARLCAGCAGRVSVRGSALVPLDLVPPPFRMA